MSIGQTFALRLLIPVPLCASAAAQPDRAGLAAPSGSGLPGFAYDAGFFPGANHDRSVPTADSILGFSVGQRPATHAQIAACLKAWADTCPRARLFEHGQTHEGRALYHLVISSEANIRRLDAIKADLTKLADPRPITSSEAQSLADSAPVVVWMAYTIHGDEMSGSDAALALAYHLCACSDEPIRSMLDEMIVIIDPLMNPDGRDRHIAQIAVDRTLQPSVDDQSLIHSRPWPAGRTNHYLFDMNRDWILGTQPETRGRWAAIGSWHPHVLLDAHEMSSQETFLFSPPREPINPHVAPSLKTWWNTISERVAGAFDRHGWRYYLGEWNDEWYPGYTTTWSACRGAVSFLFEQASISTDAVRKAAGWLETYREAVHHQLVGSLSILDATYANRRQILRDYKAQREQNVSEFGPYAQRTFAVVPSANRSRDAAFVELLQLQGIEIYAAGAEFIAYSGKDRLGREFRERTFPAGTILIPNRQPEARLIAATLEFDTRLTPDVLQDERRELLRFDRSTLYDVTAWSLVMMHDVDAYELAMPLPDAATGYARTEPPAVAEVPATEAVAWVIDGADDLSVTAAARLMEQGVRVRVAEKAFVFDDRSYARGSVVITRVDNRTFSGDVAETLRQVAAAVGAQAQPIRSGLAPGESPDLGGEHFVLLEQPRIAVLTRDPFGKYSFGEIWHHIDRTIGIRASYIDMAELAGTDLRRYNVLVVPAGAGSSLEPRMEALEAWIRAGGTLVAIGSSAAALARQPKEDSEDGGKASLTSARLMQNVVTKLDDYTLAVVREWEGAHATVNTDAVWSQLGPVDVEFPWAASGGDKKPSDDEMKRRDQWRSIFMPQGAMLAGRVDDRSFLTSGCGEYVPILFNGSTVLMAAGSVQAPVRLGAFATLPSDKTRAVETRPTDGSDESKDKQPAHWAPIPRNHEMRLRMSGLLWPEAADRLASSAWVTRERLGSGQIILFATSPTFRASMKGTMRVFSNAIIYGAGAGASQPIRP